MAMERSRTRRARSTLALILLMLVMIAFFIGWLDIVSLQKPLHLFESKEFDCSLKCSDISPLTANIGHSSSTECPEYFRWIHEDLNPWRHVGITQKMVEGAKNMSHIRITIVNGRLYTIKYKKAFQTRDFVTIWGILQLLKLYPGQVPDVDLMFECGDKPLILKSHYGASSIPPPVFHYCSDNLSHHIIFPDWSFWGWSEVNIKPWDELKEELKEANGMIKWRDREPYAYWKGNSRLGVARKDLVKCNASGGQDWKARIYGTEWAEVKKQGFNTSDLASQCTHRYKIYVEGVSWSVSQKYILACDSMTLVITPHYYDFFTRSLLPSVHYWPIGENNMCQSIKFAVEWGNKHTDKAQAIGRAGSNFVQESLAMQHIYDYSFHVLSQYANLLNYKPTVPQGSVEMCSHTLVCATKGRRKRFLKHSEVTSPAATPPCMLPPPYEPAALQAALARKENLMKKVTAMEEHAT